METTKFNELKQEVLKRAKENGACQDEYKRAYQSEDIQTLCQVLKDNFGWGCRNNVITADLIEAYKEDFAEYDIFCNTNVKRGYLLCDSATVKACGSATVEACGSATVEACGSATVEACDSATVEACDSATVEACDSATVEACDSATVKAWDSATVKAWGSATVEACDSATVKAWGYSYITSYSVIECKLSDNAIYRVRETNEIRYVSDSIKFVKVESQDETN